MNMALEFKSLSSYMLDHRNAYVVSNPFEWVIDPFIGTVQRIDGHDRHIVAVETFAHAMPIRSGELIALIAD